MLGLLFLVGPVTSLHSSLALGFCCGAQRLWNITRLAEA